MGMVGISHRSADILTRGKVSIRIEDLPAVLVKLRNDGAAECVILSTCNRTEVYFVGDVHEHVVNVLAQSARMSVAELTPHLYFRSRLCASCHLFCVASGLDSAVLGETEIVSQVKQAWQAALDASTVGPILGRAFQKALETSKRVRTETALCQNVTSIGSLAVREAEARHPDLVDLQLLVIGAGQIAERVAKELSSIGAKHVLIANRTGVNAKVLADEFGFDHAAMSCAGGVMNRADVVFATVTSPHPIITQAELELLDEDRDGRPLTIIDLGVPPNVEPGLSVRGVVSVDMDRLIAQRNQNEKGRQAAVPHALEIVDEEVEQLSHYITARESSGTIKRLVMLGDDVRERTTRWAFDKMPDLTDKQKRIVEDMARRIVLGMLEAPLDELKGGVSEEDRAVVERFFRLSDGEDAQA